MFLMKGLSALVADYWSLLTGFYCQFSVTIKIRRQFNFNTSNEQQATRNKDRNNKVFLYLCRPKNGGCSSVG